MNRALAIFVLCLALPFVAQTQSPSPKPADAEFAEKARELGKQERLKVEPQVLVPASMRPVPLPWHTNLVTTVFWIGEGSSESSAWDPQWKNHYGGTDDPDPAKRREFIPRAFVPQLNPFYCALPYNDVVRGQFRPEAPLVIPWFKTASPEQGKSVCQDRWVAIRTNDGCEGRPARVCYAQWSDCGPFVSNHFQYVFGQERPRPNANHGSGLNVSPAVRDFLRLSSTDVTNWQFVEVRDVPPGPWRSYGQNNPFVEARDRQKIASPDFRSL